MQQDWVIDVLADLRAFARTNGLTSLAEQLDDTIMVAAADIERFKCASAKVSGDHEGQAGNTDKWVAAGELVR